MVEENSDIIISNQVWNQLKSIVPERDIAVSEDAKDGGDEHGELESRMESSRKLTDLQVADKRLNPDLGDRYLNVLQMSRVFPDVYNAMFRILVKDLLKKHPEYTVAEAISLVSTALSIAIDGEGRIDEIHIMGKAVEAETEKAKKDAGLV
jgi:hypothetical protein